MTSPFSAQTYRDKFTEKIINECLANPENITGFAYAVSSYVSMNDLLMIENIYNGTKQFTKDIENKKLMN